MTPANGRKAKGKAEPKPKRTRVSRADAQPPCEIPADASAPTETPTDPPARKIDDIIDDRQYRPGNSRELPGRLASTISRRAVTWFVADLVPRECLTFVLGVPDSGKSTFGAWLCSQAKRPAVLPGYEESVEVALVPRLVANGVALERTLMLDTRLWSFPHDRQTMTDVLKRHGADLLWIDPIDTYVSECGENEGQGVRAALESLARIAVDVGCAVVCARHPGKDPRNLCPGSRQWRAVPRMLLRLSLDEGPPKRRYLSHLRDPYGSGTKPREVHLDGFDRCPRVFRLGGLASNEAVEASAVSDVIDRTMIDAAADLLTALLTGGEQESKVIYAHAETERLLPRTVRQAARRVGVIIRREGVGLEHRSYWSLAHSGSPAESVRDTPKPKSPRRRKGVPVPDCQTARVPETAEKEASNGQ